jgi:RNA polymerase sigma factor (sigma-70 family)
MNSNNNNNTHGSNNMGESVIGSFKRYNLALKRFISGYLINPQDIEDVCQETFLRTYKSSMDSDIKKPKSYMFRVAKNFIVSDFRRSSTKLNEYVEDIDLIESFLELEDLEHNVLAKEKLGIMCDAIAGLPDKCRQVVVMRKVYGLSTGDIAKRMNISTITVSNYITQGMCTYNKAVHIYNSENNQINNEQNTKPAAIGGIR